MKFRMFFVAAAMLVCSMLAFGQGFSVAWYELDQPLDAPCGSGNYLPDGTMAFIHQDVNNNGNADWAADPLADVGGGVGQVNYNTFPLNGCSDIGQCGTFATLVNFVSNGAVPANARYYIRVENGAVRHLSNVVTLVAGPADIEMSQWSCEDLQVQCVPTPGPIFLAPPTPSYFCAEVCVGSQAEVLIPCPANQPPFAGVMDGCTGPCQNTCQAGHAQLIPVGYDAARGAWLYMLVGEADGCVCIFWDGCQPPPCEGTQLVQFLANRDGGTPAYYCANVCAGQPLVIRICNPDGSPMDPSKPPYVSVAPGCDDPSTCNFPCPPGATAPMGALPFTVWTWDGLCWVTTLLGTNDGCVCICLEGFLAAEIASFTATPRSNAVEVLLATSSETDIDHFEISRNVLGHEGIEVVKTFESTNAAHTYSFMDEGLRNGTTYVYTLRTVDVSGSRSEVLATTEGTPSLEAAVVTEYALHQNFPNPFNPTTQITFDVLEASNVSLTVFNAAGQEVGTVVNGAYASGRHTVTFDAGKLTSGIYFYTVKMGDQFSATKKMLLVK